MLARLFYFRFISLLLLASLARCPGFELLEEVVALIIDKDEGGEVFNSNLPDSLHTQFGIFNTLNALDAALRENGSYTTNSAAVATTVLLASIGPHL